MADLIPAVDKAKYDTVFDSVHDTFARTIFVYKIFNSRFIGINMNQNYNGLYDQALDKNELGTASNINEQVRKIETKARVQYISKQGDFEDTATGQQTALRFPVGSIRLKLKSDAFELIKDAKEIEVDGELFNLDTDSAKSGMFSVRHHIVYLRKIQ
jgi:translation initiation factor 6 (eIF-6)